jgi:hypothetical protein
VRTVCLYTTLLTLKEFSMSLFDVLLVFRQEKTNISWQNEAHIGKKFSSLRDDRQGKRAEAVINATIPVAFAFFILTFRVTAESGKWQLPSASFN